MHVLIYFNHALRSGFLPNFLEPSHLIVKNLFILIWRQLEYLLTYGYRVDPVGRNLHPLASNLLMQSIRCFQNKPLSKHVFSVLACWILDALGQSPTITPNIFIFFARVWVLYVNQPPTKQSILLRKWLVINSSESPLNILTPSSLRNLSTVELGSLPLQM